MEHPPIQHMEFAGPNGAGVKHAFLEMGHRPPGMPLRMSSHPGRGMGGPAGRPGMLADHLHAAYRAHKGSVGGGFNVGKFALQNVAGMPLAYIASPFGGAASILAAGANAVDAGINAAKG